MSAGGVRFEEGSVVAFFDVDGTLVCRDPVTGPGSFPTERVVRAVEEFAERGGIPILSTGRARVGIDQLLNNLPFRGYVSLDGAHVVLDGKVILDCCFPRAVLERIGGAVGAISLDTRIMESAGCSWRDIHDMETLRMLGAGIIDDAQATARNMETEP